MSPPRCIQQWRARRGLSQAQAAARCNLRPSHWSNIETERRKPSHEVLKAIVRELDPSPQELKDWLSQDESTAIEGDQAEGAELPEVSL